MFKNLFNLFQCRRLEAVEFKVENETTADVIVERRREGGRLILHIGVKNRPEFSNTSLNSSIYYSTVGMAPCQPYPYPQCRACGYYRTKQRRCKGNKRREMRVFHTYPLFTRDKLNLPIDN